MLLVEPMANLISASASFAAAGLWFYSTQVKAEPTPDGPDKSGPYQITETDDQGRRWDVLATADLQVKWNRWAAVAAAIAALGQAIAVSAHGLLN